MTTVKKGFRVTLEDTKMRGTTNMYFIEKRLRTPLEGVWILIARTVLGERGGEPVEQMKR